MRRHLRCARSRRRQRASGARDRATRSRVARTPGASLFCKLAPPARRASRAAAAGGGGAAAGGRVRWLSRRGRVCHLLRLASCFGAPIATVAASISRAAAARLSRGSARSRARCRGRWRRRRRSASAAAGACRGAVCTPPACGGATATCCCSGTTIQNVTAVTPAASGASHHFHQDKVPGVPRCLGARCLRCQGASCRA